MINVAKMRVLAEAAPPKKLKKLPSYAERALKDQSSFLRRAQNADPKEYPDKEKLIRDHAAALKQLVDMYSGRGYDVSAYI